MIKLQDKHDYRKIHRYVKKIIALFILRNTMISACRPWKIVFFAKAKTAETGRLIGARNIPGNAQRDRKPTR